jgi:hypothetical protein
MTGTQSRRSSHIRKINNATIMATPYLPMKLDKPNMAKTSFKLPSSDSRGDVYPAEGYCKPTKAGGGDYVRTSISKCSQRRLEIFETFKLGWVFSKVRKMFKFLTRRSCEYIPVILAGDFNANVKDKSSRKLHSNLTFFRIFLKERLDLILASIWYLDEMWTIYPA